MGTIFEKFSARVRDSVHHLTYLTLWHSGCSINSSNNGMQHVILSYNQGRVLPWLWAGSLTSFWNHFIKTNDSVIFFSQPNFKWLIHQKWRSRSLSGKSALSSPLITLCISLTTRLTRTKTTPPTRRLP